MKVWRLYTERKRGIHKAVGRFFDGFTVYEAAGVWRGRPERDAVIEVQEDGHPIGRRVLALAHALKTMHHQQAVLVTRTLVKAALA